MEIKERIIKNLFVKIGQQKVEKVLGITFLLIFIYMVIWMKFLGATDIGIEVEKDGYCKITIPEYRKTGGYNEKKDLCYYDELKEHIGYNERGYRIYKTIMPPETRTFTEEEFREVCLKHKFISLKFNSDCWKKGDSR